MSAPWQDINLRLLARPAIQTMLTMAERCVSERSKHRDLQQLIRDADDPRVNAFVRLGHYIQTGELRP